MSAKSNINEHVRPVYYALSAVCRSVWNKVASTVRRRTSLASNNEKNNIISWDKRLIDDVSLFMDLTTLKS